MYIQASMLWTILSKQGRGNGGCTLNTLQFRIHRGDKSGRCFVGRIGGIGCTGTEGLDVWRQMIGLFCGESPDVPPK
jgi:hypothetical protein